MSATTTAPAWSRPGATTRPTFGRVERHRALGADGVAGDGAVRRVDAGRHVERHHRAGRRVQRGHGGADRAARCAGRARAEQRVDGDVGGAQQPADGGPVGGADRPGCPSACRRRGWCGRRATAGTAARPARAHLQPGAAQVAGDDEPVAAVVARRHRRRPRDAHAGWRCSTSCGRRQAGALHQHRARDAQAVDRRRIERAHLGRVRERDGADHDAGSMTTATAPASSLEWVIDRSIRPAPTCCANAADLAGQCDARLRPARRSRCPAT